MREVLDLDARRAEADGELRPVRVGGVVYELPAELPIAVPDYLARGEFLAAVRALFGDAADRVTTGPAGLSVEDVKAIAESYMVSLGEVSASSGS